MMQTYGKRTSTVLAGANGSAYELNGFGKITAYVIPSTGAVGTYKVRVSPDGTNRIDLPSASVTLVGTEDLRAASLVYTIDAVAPYVRVSADGITSGSLRVTIAFNMNN